MDGESWGWREGGDRKRLGRRRFTGSSSHRTAVCCMGMCNGQQEHTYPQTVGSKGARAAAGCGGGTACQKQTGVGEMRKTRTDGATAYMYKSKKRTERTSLIT